MYSDVHINVEISAFCLMYLPTEVLLFFFFNDTATTEIYTLSLHDALPISGSLPGVPWEYQTGLQFTEGQRSEEHTSELQSQSNLVCRLLLEKKKKSLKFSSIQPYII